MLKSFRIEKEIKDRLSEVGKTYPHLYNLLMEKIEFSKYLRIKKTIRQSMRKILAVGIKEYLINLLSKKDIIDGTNNPSNKKKILFVSGVPSFNFVGISIYLRKTGKYETILIGESPWLSNFFRQYFDNVYIYNSYYEIARILILSKPYIVHVQGMPNYYFLAILAKFLSNAAIVSGFIDIPSDDPSIENSDTLFQVPPNKLLDYFSEEYLFQKANEIILTSMTLEVGEKLRLKYKSNAPICEFFPYICDEFISEEERCLQNDGKISLVYGGSVVPSYQPKEQNAGILVIDIAKNIVGQGLHFYVYLSPHFSSIQVKRLYSDYIQLAAKVPNFVFKEGLPIDGAIKEFSRYDFALMIGVFEGVKINVFNFNTCVPSKFFTYIAAGLPVIVNKEFGYIASLVKKHEIGIVINQNEINSLSEIIKRYDYEKLKANVKRAREDLSMKKHIGRLIDFYEQAVATKTQFHEIMARKV